MLLSQVLYYQLSSFEFVFVFVSRYRYGHRFEENRIRTIEGRTTWTLYRGVDGVIFLVLWIYGERETRSISHNSGVVGEK